MKKSLLLGPLVLLQLGFVSVPLEEGKYRVRVTKMHHNLYRVLQLNLEITTHNCHEYAPSEHAIFIWGGEQSPHNQLAFVQSGQVCNVKSIQPLH